MDKTIGIASGLVGGILITYSLKRLFSKPQHNKSTFNLVPEKNHDYNL